MITSKDVRNAQENWAEALIEIGKRKNTVRTELGAFTREQVVKLYGFNHGTVLFKPTKACNVQFRKTIDAAISYFIGGNTSFQEDAGFALEPWVAVEFENHDMILDENRAIASGNYFFTRENGDIIKVEFTFGYVLDKDGQLKIDLHHSSIPFKCDAA